MNLSNKIKTATLLLFLSANTNAVPRTIDLDTGDYSIYCGLGASKVHANIELGFSVNKQLNENYQGKFGLFFTAEGTNEEHLIDLMLERKLTKNYSLGLGFGAGEQLVLTEEFYPEIADTTNHMKRLIPGCYLRAELIKKLNDRYSLLFQYKRNYFNNRDYNEPGRDKFKVGIEIALQ
ncbi:hypothetical protein HOG16_02300 [Candidatus Woesearchaeota archaeon]|nr:hypothetical protein [Candidatus Woesearchaeota archaeon]MBT4321813.1 hypothetical protein [Candidatus Woesearchaeota archaeon]